MYSMRYLALLLCLVNDIKLDTQGKNLYVPLYVDAAKKLMLHTVKEMLQDLEKMVDNDVSQ